MNNNHGMPLQWRISSTKKPVVPNVGGSHVNTPDIKPDHNDGYICDLSEKEALDAGIAREQKHLPCLGDLQFVSLTSRRLKDISILDLCSRLQICDLSNNFLSSIEPLKWCQNLIYLDLHSNQIIRLPSKSFWENMHALQTLYAHDNGICKFEDVKNLAAAPLLENLSLYDTPLSLKRNYRHCVVNAVWTLNALDFCVISDEEIIEDADFPVSRFKSKQMHFTIKKQSFKSNLKDMKIADVFQTMWKELGLIHKLQSRYCPVLIIQRVIRGFLTKLRYEYLLDTRLWAAVSIQRFYRRYKYGQTFNRSRLSTAQDALYQSLSSIKLNYDTYVRMRRSKNKSLLSLKSFNQYVVPSTSEQIVIDPKQLHRMDQHMKVQLFQLDLNEKLAYEKNIMPKDKVNKELHAEFPKLSGYEPVFDQRDPTILGKYFTQYKFLGKVVPPGITGDIEEETGFRLSVLPPARMKHGALEEMILRTIEAADDIRDAVAKIDKAREESKKVQKVSPARGKMTSEQRLFMKTHGSMSLACFRAVEQAYKDRSKVENLGEKMSRVRSVRENNKKGIEKRTRFLRRYRTEAAVQNQADAAIVQDNKEEQHEREVGDQQQLRTKRLLEKKRNKEKKDSFKFALEFCSQNASIGKALRENDRQQANIEKADHIKKEVDKMKDSTKTQRNIIKKYINHKQLLLQAETIADKVKLEGILSAKEEHQTKSSLERVERIRSKYSVLQKRSKAYLNSASTSSKNTPYCSQSVLVQKEVSFPSVKS